MTERTQMTSSTSSDRQPLNQAAIVDAAMTVADSGGLHSLSMRKLAGSLGYEVMSLYNHVANKNELLSLMVDRVAAEIEHHTEHAGSAGSPESEKALAAARSVALSARAALERHPWAASLWQRQMPGRHRIRYMETLLRLLDRTGLAPDLAHHGFHAVVNHVIGYTLQEQEMLSAFDNADNGAELEAKAQEFLDGFDADEYPYTVAHVHQHLNGDSGSSFELVLDLILDGLVHLDERRANPRSSRR